MRVLLPAASLVWSVDNTMWPVSADYTAILAVSVGTVVTLAMLAVLTTPIDRRLSDYFEVTSWPEAFGRNIVNVILVDFRALDTFGEIAVVGAGVATTLTLVVAASASRIAQLLPREGQTVVFGFASWASRIPSIKENFDFNEAELGNLLLAMPISSLIGLPISGWLVSQFNSRVPLFASFVVFALSLYAIGSVSRLDHLVIAVSVFSFCMRI